MSGLLTVEGDGEAPAAGRIQVAGEIDLNTDVMKGEGRLQLNGLKEAPPLKIRLNGPVLLPQRQIESAALGVFYVDDFAKRANVTAKDEVDRQIDMFREAIDKLENDTESASTDTTTETVN